jgi:MFS family permease
MSKPVAARASAASWPAWFVLNTTARSPASTPKRSAYRRGFGWSGPLPPALLLAFAALYGFAALGDSSVLSTAMSETVAPAYLGRALAIRSILGIGIGAAAPAAFGAVLDLSAPGHGWGWAFALMGLGGVVATVCAARLPAAPAPSAPSGRLRRPRGSE